VFDLIHNISMIICWYNPVGVVEDRCLVRALSVAGSATAYKFGPKPYQNVRRNRILLDTLDILSDPGEI
jgi:hypothetical protein